VWNSSSVIGSRALQITPDCKTRHRPGKQARRYIAGSRLKLGLVKLGCALSRGRATSGRNSGTTQFANINIPRTNSCRCTILKQPFEGPPRTVQNSHINNARRGLGLRKFPKTSPPPARTSPRQKEQSEGVGGVCPASEPRRRVRPRYRSTLITLSLRLFLRHYPPNAVGVTKTGNITPSGRM
jgi:hypothetical protein